MNDIYLVEIRLGRTKWRVRQTVASIARVFGIGQFMERHPHVTLFGPMELLEGVSQQQLIDAIGTVASHYGPVPFTLDGFEKREGMHGSVIAFSVRPSDSLVRLVAEMAGALLPICRSHNAWDDRPELKWYHVTVANHLEQKRASAVFQALPGPDTGDGQSAQPGGFLSGLRTAFRSLFESVEARNIRPLLIDETGLRISLMHGEEILAEYDLLEKCWLHDNHRHDSRSWNETLSRFRKDAGFERTEPRLQQPGDTLLIADLHLGHANIIRYCSRPFLFSDPGGMDRVLIANWNAVVTPGTRTYHIGDLCYGRTARPEHEYREHLHGEVTFIAGNHDAPGPGACSSAVIEHAGTRFFLVHDPADAPAAFDGWVIHGHHHNNDLRHYPFIDFEHRRINVSAEVAGYVPVSLEETWTLVQYRLASGNTKPVLLNYPGTE
ncbi:MAG: 2'-5' RNA ligase family protein [Methanoregula sp.]|jgi:calcineurin-like phosphoesterase family protein|uniref:2'-5' RNA ligase family protein n=1 Tax=Methanoregula sp. TaxID=2052170 RepID=UPI0025FFA441|nr:2'-5' RNA ligase family protein [Methanoregula sp.]MCK9630970.1 2'-5' RNA ligase family protein [Methanoregula sp.]